MVLNPTLTICRQLMEVPITHDGESREEARRRASRVLRDVHLDEQDALVGVDAGGQQPDRHVGGALRQFFRLVGLGDGVQVDDAENALEAVLELNPVPDRAEVVADVKLARGLDAA